jgi:hypothetical protein
MPEARSKTSDGATTRPKSISPTGLTPSFKRQKSHADTSSSSCVSTTTSAKYTVVPHDINSAADAQVSSSTKIIVEANTTIIVEDYLCDLT